MTKTKKNSTMVSDKLLENKTVGEEQKPIKAASAIDEIFASKKRKKSDVKKGGKADEASKSSDEASKSSDKTKKRTNEKKKSKRVDEGEYIERSSRSRKKTVDGLTIYTEEELGLSKGDAGDTSLCPFDCSCCF